MLSSLCFSVMLMCAVGQISYSSHIWACYLILTGSLDEGEVRVLGVSAFSSRRDFPPQCAPCFYFNYRLGKIDARDLLNHPFTL